MKIYSAEEKEHILIVKKYATKGILLTHTRCMGAIEEHIFNGKYDGPWMCGRPTRMTKRFGGSYTNDIHPRNVTHINREAVESYDILNKELIKNSE